MSIKHGREVIRIESNELQRLASRLNQNFVRAVNLMHKCQGRVVVTGMGKTGIIARKIAATLSSTGTPSIWMHSADAAHGDLGQVRKEDVVIIISYSGETEETKRLVPLIKKIGSKVIAVTGRLKSSLAKYSDIVLDVSVRKEGCPLGLAPMASTTVTLALGDALAACLIYRKGFRKEDFAFYHPGGTLGRRLLLKVEDIMRGGTAFPKVKETSVVKDVLLAITRKRCGSACVIDKKGNLKGIFTDGDLRRHLETDPNLALQQVKDVMTKNPITITRDQLAADAYRLLKERKIDEIPVVDKKNKVVGLLDIQDLLRSGVI